MLRLQEIVQHEEYYPYGSDEIKASLVICLWNMEHLLIRSIETYCRQDFPNENWELIIVSDNSEGDIQPIVDYAKNRINLQIIKLKHDWGMRGNTVAFNTGFQFAKGQVYMETTAETMFTTDMVRKLYEPHLIHDRIFVAAKTYNLENHTQLKIDSVNWHEDVSNIMNLEGFFCDWTLNNFKNTHFGTHQTCSIKKSLFYELFPNGFPAYGDYGSEDPRYAGLRSQKGVKDMTIMQPMAFHQWHPSFQFWMSLGKAPMLNKFAHSMSNYLGDTSGEVPEGGTCMIWDGGSHEPMDEAQIADCRTWDERVIATGVNPKLIYGNS